METPEYKVIQDSFMEPNYVKAGSIVRTWGPPGPHLEPLNASAREQMEKWYDEEHDEIEVKTGKPTGKKERPHAKFRVRSNFAAPTDRHHVEIVSGPQADQPGSLSLAETLANHRTSTDQRPPPLQQFRMPGSPVPVAVSPTPPTKPDVPPPTMGDGPGKESPVPEGNPVPAPELPATPSTSAGGELGNSTETVPPPSAQTATEGGSDGMGDSIPAQAEPEATQVVFSAPPPSAKRIS